MKEWIESQEKGEDGETDLEEKFDIYESIC